MKRQLISILCAAAITCSAGATNVADFSDVRPSDWYCDAVKYVFENGLMNGTSDTVFSPNATTSRGMIVTILYRLAGSPDLPESNWGYPYADVDVAAYYSTPVYWARMNDLVTGYSDTQFGQMTRSPANRWRPSCTDMRKILNLTPIPTLYRINTTIFQTIKPSPAMRQMP